MKKRKMIAGLTMIALFSFSLFGCSSNTQQQESAVTEEIESEVDEIQEEVEAEAEVEEASLVDACIVTEVLDWGETVTALRLEYSEEIWSGAIEYAADSPAKLTYSLVNDRDITHLYVNNSGKKDDVQVTGKYVFINLGLADEDQLTYRDQIVFNQASVTRPALSHFCLFQNEEIETVNGNIIPALGCIEISNEMRIGIDDFKTFTYTNEENDTFLNYHLYIPEGYDTKGDSLEDLPLVVHFPASDFGYEDDGRYLGALFTHPEVLYWTAEEAQREHPAFVVTVGGIANREFNNVFTTEESAMLDNYLTIIRQITEDYNVDTSRIYAFSISAGTTPMYYSILEHPNLFAAQITVSMDTYQMFKDFDEIKTLGEEKLDEVLNTVPSWLFAGLTDATGAGFLGEDDTRTKGERLRDLGILMNEKGHNVDIGYGEQGELMWNGLLRGEEAEAQADEQLARAAENGSESLITLYIPGTIKPSMHWAWNATYSNASVRDWMFSHVNENPSF